MECQNIYYFRPMERKFENADGRGGKRNGNNHATFRRTFAVVSILSWLRLDTDGPTPDNLREMLRNI